MLVIDVKSRSIDNSGYMYSEEEEIEIFEDGDPEENTELKTLEREDEVTSVVAFR